MIGEDQAVAESRASQAAKFVREQMLPLQSSAASSSASVSEQVGTTVIKVTEEVSTVPAAASVSTTAAAPSAAPAPTASAPAAAAPAAAAGPAAQPAGVLQPAHYLHSYNPGRRCQPALLAVPKIMYLVTSNPSSPNMIGVWVGPKARTWSTICQTLQGRKLFGSGAQLKKVGTLEEAWEMWKVKFPESYNSMLIRELA